jgi:hypothetical protein
MGLAKSILLTALGVFLSLYSFDCGGMTTPDQAMECCKSMTCSTGGHQGEDCCKVMPAMHSPFVQTSVAHGLTYSPVVAVTFETNDGSHGEDSSARGIAEISHPPPIFRSSIPLPLRV